MGPILVRSVERERERVPERKETERVRGERERERERAMSTEWRKVALHEWMLD